MRKFTVFSQQSGIFLLFQNNKKLKSLYLFNKWANTKIIIPLSVGAW